MLKNYLKVAFRHLTTDKAHSFINIAGLSVGMAVALLIGLWVWDELSFDRSNAQHDRIAAVMQNMTMNGSVQTWAGTPFPTADELRTHYGDNFKEVAIGTTPQSHELTAGNKQFLQTGGWWEPGATDVFDLHMIRGTRASLTDPQSILLSASVAKAFFGDRDPVGQMMRLDKKMLVRVSGVYEDLPANTSFVDLHYIAAWQLLYDDWGLSTRPSPWRMSAFCTLVVLNDKVDFAGASARIKDAKLRHVQGPEALAKPQYWLHPMNEWRLHSEYKNGVSVGGEITFVWLFGTIGLFVLLLACINFMNLSTARSERRAREVGIRKAIGSLRRQLVVQFFIESLVMSLLAFAVALLLGMLLIPFFNDVSGKKITMPWDQPLFWITGFGFAVITGLIAGSYPALYLSSFRPIEVLKGDLTRSRNRPSRWLGLGFIKTGASAAMPRRVLTVLQFSVSVTLIIGTIVVFRQVQYAQDRPPGYSNNGLVMVHMISGGIHDHFDAVRHDLLQTGVIRDIAEGESFPTSTGVGSGFLEWPGKDPAMATSFATSAIGYGYGRVIGWQLDQGRDFSPDHPTDTAAFIINQSAVRYMGLKNPVGTLVHWFGRPYHIIGVVKDMITASPYQDIQPFFYYIYSYSQGNVIAKLNPEISTRQALATLTTVFKKYDRDQPPNFVFADEAYATKFGDEQRIGKLAGFFASLAIFISCLGLFGMASFVAERRTKEIGVRKVLGASVSSLWGLLSKEFLVLVGISLCIAIPVADYSMHQWLQKYSYRAPLSWWIFAAAALGALGITLLTVSWQTVRAAMANPVKSLRSE